jgi:hypothetical protein
MEWYSLGVVYRDLLQHHHNLMDEVRDKLSAEGRYVTVLSRYQSCSFSPDKILSLAFTAVNQIRRRYLQREVQLLALCLQACKCLRIMVFRAGLSTEINKN